MRTLVVAGVMALAAAGQADPVAVAKDPDPRPFTDGFTVPAAAFTVTGSNAYFILEPGYVLEYAGTEDGQPATLTITVLHKVKTVAGIMTREVEERETVGGMLKEVSRNYYAMDRRTSSIYYFGEDVDEYEGGRVTGHGSSWMAGVNSARYGLMMPGTVLLGARFYEESAAGAALDRAEVVSLSETVVTPARNFDRCLKTEETTPLEPGSREYKLYAPGIGLVQDGDLKLVKFGKR